MCYFDTLLKAADSKRFKLMQTRVDGDRLRPQLRRDETRVDCSFPFPDFKEGSPSSRITLPTLRKTSYEATQIDKTH